MKQLRVYALDASAPESAQPLIRLKDVRDAVIAGCVAPPTPGKAVDAAGSEGVRLVGNDFSRAAG